MAKKVFVIEWDEDKLGKGWMNIYNLELCLYSKEHTRRDLVTVREISIPFPSRLQKYWQMIW